MVVITQGSVSGVDEVSGVEDVSGEVDVSGADDLPAFAPITSSLCCDAQKRSPLPQDHTPHGLMWVRCIERCT